MPTERCNRRLTLAAALMLAAAGAMAQSSPWFVSGSLSMTHDDNLLRLGDTQSALAGQSRSDTVRSTALIGGLDQSIGRQRLQANLTLRDNRFERNSPFDNESYSGGLTLDWSTVNRVSGRLALNRARALSTFNTEVFGLLAQRNFETTQAVDANLRIGLVTALTLELSGSVRRERNSLDEPTVQAQNLDQEIASLGLGWQSGGALELTLSARESRGTYPSFRREGGVFVEDGFRQRGFELSARWLPSGASQLEARIGSGQTRYDQSLNRDFDGVNGSLIWRWRPTGKLTAFGRLARERGQDSYLSFVPVGRPPFQVQLPSIQANRRTTDSFSWQMEWAASAKVGVSAGVQHARRDATVRTRALFDNALLFAAEGVDSTTVGTLGARWAPTHWASVGCDLRHEDRRATGNVTTGLKGTSLSCYAQATLR